MNKEQEEGRTRHLSHVIKCNFLIISTQLKTLRLISLDLLSKEENTASFRKLVSFKVACMKYSVEINSQIVGSVS
jgi:hypothetical protein